MVGDEFAGKQKNPKHYWPMDKAGVLDRVERYTGTCRFPELQELVPEVVKQDPETQHWFTDRTRAAYNAGMGGQLAPVRKRDSEVAEAVGPTAFNSYFARVYALGKERRVLADAATKLTKLTDRL